MGLFYWGLRSRSNGNRKHSCLPGTNCSGCLVRRVVARDDLDSRPCRIQMGNVAWVKFFAFDYRAHQIEICLRVCIVFIEPQRILSGVYQFFFLHSVSCLESFLGEARPTKVTSPFFGKRPSSWHRPEKLKLSCVDLTRSRLPGFPPNRRCGAVGGPLPAQ